MKGRSKQKESLKWAEVLSILGWYFALKKCYYQNIFGDLFQLDAH